MLASERKCGIAPMQGMFWYSSELRNAARNLSNIKRHIQWLYRHNVDEDEIWQAKLRRSEAMKCLREAHHETWPELLVHFARA